MRWLSRRWGWVDLPDGRRKLHTAPVSAVGGIAIGLAYVGAFVVLLASDFSVGRMVRAGLPDVLRLVPAVAVVFLVGLVDDVRGLKPWQKLVGQMVAVGLAIHAGVEISGFRGYEFSNWLSYPVTVVWLIGMTNAVNLIDGIDGLAAGVGLFATVTTLGAALMTGNVALAMATMPLAGALLGFLRYNFNPASIFLGDCGSLPLGFLLGCFAVLWSQKSATLLGVTAPLLVLAVPLADTALAILRRYMRGEPIFTGDRGHIHHKLLQRGLTPRRAALVLYAVCGAAASLSLLMSKWANFTGLILVLFCAGTWIGISQLGYTEFGTARKMVLQGAFRRLFTAELSLGSFESEVREAKDVEECWRVMEAWYGRFGYCSMHAEMGGKQFSHEHPVEVEGRVWQVWIPLDGGDFVKLSRSPGAAVPLAGAGVFAETAGTVVAERLKVLRGRTGVSHE